MANNADTDDDADVYMQDATATTDVSSNTKKLKRKRPTKNLNISQFSCRHPEWTYIHLRHMSSTQRTATTDETSIRLFIDAALSQFLGLHGKAISVDFFKLQEHDIWLRIPHPDRQAFIAALSAWIGRNGDALRIIGTSSWDANAHARDAGQDLFTD